MIEEISRVAELPYCWEKLSGKTILMSGGTGFIGSFICDVIRYRNNKYNQRIQVISLSRRGGLNEDCVKYLKVDVSKPFHIDEKIDYIIHLASNTHPRQYAEDPIGTITTNVYGCDNLLSIAVENESHFLLVSSVEIYGQGSNIPMKEYYSGYIDCNQFRSGYNEAKRVCESLMQAYRVKFSIFANTVRLSRVFGADKKVDTKAIAQFIDKAVSGEDIILNSNGNQRYSFCYVADAASAIIKVLFDGVDGEVYNVAADDDGLTLGGYAEYLASLAGKQVVYQIKENNAASKATYALLDCHKLKELGWKPLYTIKEGLKRTYQIKISGEII